MASDPWDFLDNPAPTGESDAAATGSFRDLSGGGGEDPWSFLDAPSLDTGIRAPDEGFHVTYDRGAEAGGGVKAPEETEEEKRARGWSFLRGEYGAAGRGAGGVIAPPEPEQGVTPRGGFALAPPTAQEIGATTAAREGGVVAPPASGERSPNVYPTLYEQLMAARGGSGELNPRQAPGAPGVTGPPEAAAPEPILDQEGRTIGWRQPTTRETTPSWLQGLGDILGRPFLEAAQGAREAWEPSIEAAKEGNLPKLALAQATLAPRSALEVGAPLVGGYLEALGKPSQWVERDLVGAYLEVANDLAQHPQDYERGGPMVTPVSRTGVKGQPQQASAKQLPIGREEIIKALAALPEAERRDAIDHLRDIAYSPQENQLQALRDVQGGMDWKSALEKNSAAWNEFAGQALLDPLWFVPAKWAKVLFAPMNKAFELGAKVVGEASGELFKKIPWVRQAELGKQATLFADRASDALGELFGSKAPTEDVVAKWGRVLAGDIDASISQKSQEILREIAPLFEREFKASVGRNDIGDMMPRVWKKYNPGATRLYDEASTGQVQDTLRRAAVDGYRQLIGLAPADTKPGMIARALNGMGSFLKESWLSDPLFSVAYVATNTPSDFLRAVVTGHSMNPLDRGAEAKVREIVGGLGMTVPRTLDRTLFGSIVGREGAQRALGATEKIPLPLVGRPSEFAKAFDTLMGTRLQARPLFNELETTSPLVTLARNFNYGSLRSHFGDVSQALERNARLTMFYNELKPALPELRERVAKIIESDPGVGEDLRKELAGKVRGFDIKTPQDLLNVLRGLEPGAAPRIWDYHPAQAIPEESTAFLRDLSQRLKGLKEMTPEGVTQAFTDAKARATRLVESARQAVKEAAVKQEQEATAQAASDSLGKDPNLWKRLEERLTNLRAEYGTVTDGYLRRLEMALTWNPYREFNQKAVDKERANFIRAWKFEKAPGAGTIALDPRNLTTWSRAAQEAYQAVLKERLTAKKIGIPDVIDLDAVAPVIADIQQRAEANWRKLLEGSYPAAADRPGRITAKEVMQNLLTADHAIWSLSDGRFGLKLEPFGELAAKVDLARGLAGSVEAQFDKMRPAQRGKALAEAGMGGLEIQRFLQDAKAAFADLPERVRDQVRAKLEVPAAVRGQVQKIDTELSLLQSKWQGVTRRMGGGNPAWGMKQLSDLEKRIGELKAERTRLVGGAQRQTQHPSGGLRSEAEVAASNARSNAQFEAMFGPEAGPAPQGTRAAADYAAWTDEMLAGLQATLDDWQRQALGKLPQRAETMPTGAAGEQLAGIERNLQRLSEEEIALKTAQRAGQIDEQQFAAKMADLRQRIAAAKSAPEKGTYNGAYQAARSIPKDVADRWAQALADELRTAVDNAAFEVNRQLFDYSTKGGFERILSALTPFYKYQTGIIPWAIRTAEEHPALPALAGKYERASELDVEQRHLPPRFKGSMPAPRGVSDAVQGAWNATLGEIYGKAPTGVDYRVDPKNLLAAVFGVTVDFPEPFYTAKGNQVLDTKGEVVMTLASPAAAARFVENETKGFKEDTPDYVRTLRSLVDGMGQLGMRPWPQAQVVLYKMGVYGDQYPSDILPITTAVRAATGARGTPVDFEKGLKDWESGGAENRVLRYYTAVDLAKRVNARTLSEEAAMQALADPESKVWKETQRRAQNSADVRAMERKFIPMTVRAVDEGEQQLRAQGGELGQRMDALAAARQQNNLPAIEAAKAAINDYYAAHPEMSVWGLRGKTPDEAAVRADTDALLEANRQADAALQAGLAKLPVGYKGPETDKLYEANKKQKEENAREHPRASFASTAEKAPAEIEDAAKRQAIAFVLQSEPKYNDETKESQWGGDYKKYQAAHDQWEARLPQATADYNRAQRPAEAAGKSVASITPADILEYRRRNDTVQDAANAVWFDHYYSPQQEELAKAREKYKGDELTLKEREIAARYPTPTPDQLVAWIGQDYAGRFTPEQLATAPTAIWSLAQRQAAGQTDADRQVSALYDVTGNLPPGKSDEFWQAVNALANPAAKAQALKEGKAWVQDIDFKTLWYNTADKVKGLGDKLPLLADAMQRAAAQLKVGTPSDAELREWIQAQKEMDAYHALTEAKTRATYWDAHPLLTKYFSNPNSDESRWWDAYGSLPPGGKWAKELLDGDPRFSILLDKTTRPEATPAMYRSATVKALQWLAANPDKRGDPRYYDQARKENEELKALMPPTAKVLQDEYFAPGTDRRAFLAQHPELKGWWDTETEFAKTHPVYSYFYQPEDYAKYFGTKPPTADWKGAVRPELASAATAGAGAAASTVRYSTRGGGGGGGGGYGPRQGITAPPVTADYDALKASVELVDGALWSDIQAYLGMTPGEGAVLASRSPALAAWLAGKPADYMQRLREGYGRRMRERITLLSPKKSYGNTVRYLGNKG